MSFSRALIRSQTQALSTLSGKLSRKINWRCISSQPFQERVNGEENSSHFGNNNFMSAFFLGSSIFGGYSYYTQKKAKLEAANEMQDMKPSFLEKFQKSYEKFKEEKTGHYENRLRAYSHPLKVFQYFASVHTKHGDFMTPMDFIISITPYQTRSEVEDKKKKKKKFKTKCESAISFFKLADTDGDGLISFDEYMFFLSLMATPPHYFQIAFKMFDIDGSGSIDLYEFQQMILQTNSNAVSARQGRRERSHVSQNLKHGLLSHLFGDRHSVDFTTFETFLNRLQEEVLKLEFFSYDTDEKDTISMKDFARAIISYATNRDDYSKIIENLPQTKTRISYQEFKMFNAIVHHIEDIGFAIHIFTEGGTHRGLSKLDLERAIKASSNIEINQEILDLLFTLFDTNQDGELNSEELVDVIKGRYFRGLDHPRDLGFDRLVERLISCAKY